MKHHEKHCWKWVLFLFCFYDTSAIHSFNPYKFLSNSANTAEIQIISAEHILTSSSSTSSSPDIESSLDISTTTDDIRKHGSGGFTPTLLFLFAFADKASASPLNPQALAISGPFFQGWLLRTVDHSRNGSGESLLI